MSGSVNILITTYNRPVEWERLVRILLGNTPRVSILSLNDGSSLKYPTLHFPPPALEDLRLGENYGKEKWCDLVNIGLEKIKKRSGKYFIFMPDDIIIENDFIEKLIEKYEAIPDEKKICLSYLFFQKFATKGNWGSPMPEKVGEYWKTQWMDMAFIVEQDKFFNAVKPLLPMPKDRWKNNPGLSTGVGQQLTNMLRKAGNLYHVEKSLAHHGTHESVMHPEERKQNPMVTE